MNPTEEIAGHRLGLDVLAALEAGDRRTAQRHLNRIFKWDKSGQTAWYMLQYYVDGPGFEELQSRLRNPGRG